MKVACVLLAAGLGSRMGGNKLSIRVGGETLIERAAALAASLPFSERIAVVRPSDEAVHQAVRRAGLKPVLNPDPARGIASSLKIGLAAAKETDPDGVLFLVSDQPGLTADTVERMLRLFKSEPGMIVRPRSAAGVPGNPVLFPKELFSELAETSGDTGGKAVIHAHPERVRFVECNKGELKDIDTSRDIGQ